MSEMSLSEVLPGAFPDPPPSRGGRGAARQQRNRKKRRRRSVTIVLLTVLLVGGAAAGAYTLGIRPLIERITAPKDYTGQGTGSVQVAVPAGATGRVIAKVLAAADVVKTPGAFLDAATNDSRATRVQPGTYTLHKQMSAAAALTMLLDPASKITLTVTIPEGTRAKDALVLIAKQLHLKINDLRAASMSPDIELPPAAQGKLEGFLFPSTYEFGPGVTATEALRTIVAHGRSIYEALGIPSSQLRRTVITASIIQAEAGNKPSMGKVSRVLSNRLKQDMMLRLDSTVSYAVQNFAVTTTKADRASRSKYNTYRYYGLPAGPIANPGEDALKAALNPTPGPWLYFVTINPDTGETKFATTGAGHEANVREFQQWLRTHKK